MNMKFGAVVLDSNISDRLSDFYAQLLGWEKIVQDEEWIIVRSTDGEGTPLVFQQIEGYEKPTWPAQQGSQQQQVHLDMYVEEVAPAVEYAISCGAHLNPVQLEEDWKVMLDPAGHPFCILPMAPPQKD